MWRRCLANIRAEDDSIFPLRVSNVMDMPANDERKTTRHSHIRLGNCGVDNCCDDTAPRRNCRSGVTFAVPPSRGPYYGHGR